MEMLLWKLLLLLLRGRRHLASLMYKKFLLELQCLQGNQYSFRKQSLQSKLLELEQEFAKEPEEEYQSAGDPDLIRRYLMKMIRIGKEQDPMVHEKSLLLHLRDILTKMRMVVLLLVMLGLMVLSEKKPEEQTVSLVESMVILTQMASRENILTLLVFHVSLVRMKNS